MPGIQKSLTKAVDFASRKCSGFTGSTHADEEVTLGGDVTEKVAKFSYHRDVRSPEERVQEAVTARIRSE